MDELRSEIGVQMSLKGRSVEVGEVGQAPSVHGGRHTFKESRSVERARQE